jgi:hypothetical protein
LRCSCISDNHASLRVFFQPCSSSRRHTADRWRRR